MEAAASPQGPPTPDPALRAFDPFIGTWSIKGHLLGSDEENIVGRATYRWLEGGFFLVQDIELDFAGQYEVKSHELIGYDPETKGFSSLVFSNLAPAPLPYTWDVKDRAVTIAVNYGPLDATFKGEMSEDRKGFSGGWRPNPGADETVNVPYDIAGTRQLDA
jgi:Protein of unknown function (DUF1579)